MTIILRRMNRFGTCKKYNLEKGLSENIALDILRHLAKIHLWSLSLCELSKVLTIIYLRNYSLEIKCKYHVYILMIIIT